MSTFSIKRGDTLPILEVALKNPDGSPHDLTGATAFKLYVRLNNSTVLTRDMVKQGLDTAGVLRYTWLSTDWDPGNLPTSIPQYRTKRLPMEYEVVSGASRMTFPNNGTDILEIQGDIA